MDYPTYLEHYGILGMRWGHTKATNDALKKAKSEKQYTKDEWKVKKRSVIYNQTRKEEKQVKGHKVGIIAKHWLAGFGANLAAFSVAKLVGLAGSTSDNPKVVSGSSYVAKMLPQLTSTVVTADLLSTTYQMINRR